MALRILLVEDDNHIALGIGQWLAREGYGTDRAANGEDGFFRISTEQYDLVLMDLGLPGRDGYQVLEAVRERNNDVPVIVISSRDQADDRVRALRAGADDFITKPCDLMELSARIEAVLRRGSGEAACRFKVGDLFMNAITRKVERQGKAVDLTTRETELLEYLMHRAHRIVSRGMLAKDVWKEVNRATPLDNVIDVHIARLRKKVDDDHPLKLIRTIRGVGFMLSNKEPT